MNTKYPRTPHLPWSPGSTVDDIEMLSVNWRLDDDVVITEKMDGENTTIGRDYVHARSMDSGYHPSRTWVKKFASTWQYWLPEDVRIVGENLYAKHSIHYTDLDSYFLGFAAFDAERCLSWDETMDLFSVLEIQPVTIYYRGHYEGAIEWMDKYKDFREPGIEGYVIRTANEFPTSAFADNVGKYVRSNFLPSEVPHWLSNTITRNSIERS